MSKLREKLNVKSIEVNKFLELYEVSETNLLSDEFVDQLEDNGYRLYYMDIDLESILEAWNDEFEGDRGEIEDNLTVFNIDGLHVAMWD